MTKIVHVTRVEPLADHHLRLTFEDGVEGEVDLSARRWRGVFAPLEDQVFFEQVELDTALGTIVWPNGVDIAPETLHRWVTEPGSQSTHVSR